MQSISQESHLRSVTARLRCDVAAKASASKKGGKILVGTASWSDPGFVERWYPKGMRPVERLGWYAQHFGMVEVNSTFYSVPDARMVERWCRSTPDDFIFDVKLPQLLSHHSTLAKFLPPVLRREAEIDAGGRVKLAPDLEKSIVDLFLNAISILSKEEKLGTFLLQLSPAFSPRNHELGELEQLIKLLRGFSLAIEFRNRNWAVGDQLGSTIEFLRKYKVSFVNVDAPATDHFTIMPPDLNEITNRSVAYLRLHGRDAKAYLTGKTVAARFNYDYSGKEIEEVAERARKLGKDADEVHVVFNNNALDFAPAAATRLRVALGQVFSPPPQTAELF